MTEVQRIVRSHMSRRLRDMYQHGRSASIVITHDGGAELTWCGGKPIYYAHVADAVLAGRLWVSKGHRPNAAKTLVGVTL